MSALALEVLRVAWFDGVASDALQPLGDGHINDTFLVQIPARTGSAASDQYVLQQISARVFTDPLQVMDNVGRVLGHCADTELPLPELISSRQGTTFWTDDSGSVWRLWRFRQNTRVLSAPLLAEEARQAGWAFGTFQRLMSTLPEPPLPPVLNGFLDLRHYLQEYDRAVAESDPVPCRDEQNFIAAARDVLVDRLLPGRDCIHGDCKLDNLLFAAGSSTLDCVIDLDTVMLGHWAWDFGDLARSIATTEGSVVPDLVIAAALGFCAGKGIGGSADSAESSSQLVDTLLEAPGYVTFMLAVRFLTDHLRGDQYFKVVRAGDNLRRARDQIALYRNFAEHLPELRNRLNRAISQAL